jgi:hypothetical protein
VPALLVRQIKADEVVCPAGELVGDADVRCNIEIGLIEGRANPTTVAGFCCGSYDECLSWVAAKRAAERGYDLHQLMTVQRTKGSQMRTQKMLRDARLRRQQELLNSDTPEGRKFRERIRRVMALSEARGRAASERTA